MCKDTLKKYPLKMRVNKKERIVYVVHGRQYKLVLAIVSSVANYTKAKSIKS